MDKGATLNGKKQMPEIGLHNLFPPRGSRRRKKIVGRGPRSGHGKTSTRGSKGQTSRTGRDFYVGFEGGQSPLIRKIPKRGFNSLKKRHYEVVNLRQLALLSEDNITLSLLREKGMVKGKRSLVKILGEGTLTRPITIEAHAFSANAMNKIKEAGGAVRLLEVN